MQSEFVIFLLGVGSLTYFSIDYVIELCKYVKFSKKDVPLLDFLTEIVDSMKD